MARFKGSNPEFNEHMEEMHEKGASAVEIIRRSPKGSSLSRLRAVAEKYMLIDPLLSFAAAVNRALMDRPDLYEAYLEETNRA